MDLPIRSTYDSVALSQLRVDAASDPRANAQEVSKEFEAVFIDLLLKSMRRATPRSELFSSETSRTYESMFDQEIARQVAMGDGIGLARAIEGQLFSAARPENALGAADSVNLQRNLRVELRTPTTEVDDTF